MPMGHRLAPTSRPSETPSLAPSVRSTPPKLLLDTAGVVLLGLAVTT
jgi:hypothetical protein